MNLAESLQTEEESSEPQSSSRRSSIFNIFEKNNSDRDRLSNNKNGDSTKSIDPLEKQVLDNITSIRDLNVEDIMTPKADILSVDVRSDINDVIDLMLENRHYYLPVYRETLDDALGVINVFDILNWKNRKKDMNLAQFVHPVLFVSPYMGVLELLMEMNLHKNKIALVVDEFGGVDGIVSMADLWSVLINDAQEENQANLQYFRLRNEYLEIHARAPLELIEKVISGFNVSDEEKEEIDTIGGLIASICGHIPSHGELVTHPESQIEFEIIGVDPRKIHWIRLNRNLSAEEKEHISNTLSK